MKLVYLRGKMPVILNGCGFNLKYEHYYRELNQSRYSGIEWLRDEKVLGTIDNKHRYIPLFHYSITPKFQKKIAKIIKHKIRMRYGRRTQLYYYNGLYHSSYELFGK